MQSGCVSDSPRIVFIKEGESGMILIIAEKPSLGRNIAAGIGKMSRRDGYLEGEGYLISWAFGHLFSLADVEAYGGGGHEEKPRWRMDNLPCFPETFQFEMRKDADHRVDSGVLKQFSVLEALCNREDVDTIVNAGDADREGEIIVRLCVSNAMNGNINKKFLRLWLPDQTPETVSAALKDMKDESEYQKLADEGQVKKEGKGLL